MPDSLKTTLVNEDSTNALSGVVPKLASLLRRDDDVYIAFLCSENAVQVTKLPNDGGRFCGYRNMQMLCLALGKSTWHETPNLLDRKLKIPELQGMIEHAWDQGINAQARNQTGGIKGTRKHVGTLEVSRRTFAPDCQMLTSLTGRSSLPESQHRMHRQRVQGRQCVEQGLGLHSGLLSSCDARESPRERRWYDHQASRLLATPFSFGHGRWHRDPALG